MALDNGIWWALVSVSVLSAIESTVDTTYTWIVECFHAYSIYEVRERARRRWSTLQSLNTLWYQKLVRNTSCLSFVILIYRLDQHPSQWHLFSYEADAILIRLIFANYCFHLSFDKTSSSMLQGQIFITWSSENRIDIEKKKRICSCAKMAISWLWRHQCLSVTRDIDSLPYFIF